MTFIAGAYTATYNSTTIGATEEGFEILESPHEQEIKTDEFGETVVDKVNLGNTTRIRLTFVEYDSIKTALYAAHTQGDPKAKTGRLVSASAAALVLTPVAGTTAAAESSTWTFHKVVVDGDFSVLLSSRHRKGPVTFLAMPDSSNANKTYTVAGVSPPPPPP